MRPGTQNPSVIRFENYELDLAAEELRKQGSSLKLQPQPFKILAYLASRPGELITRQELRDHVWPGDTFVDFDLAINQAIKQIRAVLNDDAERPRVIATLPRRGYRFIAKTAPTAVAEPALAQVSSEGQEAGSNGPAVIKHSVLHGSRARPWLALGAAVLLIAAVIAYRYVTPKRPAVQMRIVVLPFQNLTGDPSQEFFTDGMTEEMISQLGAMDPKRLGVIARTSAVKYRNSGKGIDQIGHELGVDALELKPTYEEAHHSYFHYLTLAGRHDEAIQESQLLLRLDPLSSHMNSHLGLAYVKAGRFEEALAQFKKTIALDPNYMRVYGHLGNAYESHKMFPEAITTYKKGVSLAGETLEGQADLARALIEGGEKKEGLLILRRLESEATRRYVSTVDLAGLYTVLGDHEKALTLLENALEQRNGRLLFIHQYHEFDPLRNSPRFTRILQAIGAPATV
jgi:DNA-binding winged helix-turn-helix (wHTH) protein/Flp pilus assembly protein TadD